MYPASAQTSRTPRQARYGFHSSGRFASWTDAAVIIYVQDQAGHGGGDVPLAAVDLMALAQPRLAFGTVSAARMDWEPTALGWDIEAAVVEPNGY